LARYPAAAASPREIIEAQALVSLSSLARAASSAPARASTHLATSSMLEGGTALSSVGPSLGSHEALATSRDSAATRLRRHRRQPRTSWLGASISACSNFCTAAGGMSEPNSALARKQLPEHDAHGEHVGAASTDSKLTCSGAI